MALTEIEDVDGTKAQCIDNCFAAAQACEWCATECARMGDDEMSRCIELCRDVADLTTDHARFMARESEFSEDLAATCADACEECAEECARFGVEHCQVCADVLEDCAATCREMATTA